MTPKTSYIYLVLQVDFSTYFNKVFWYINEFMKNYEVVEYKLKQFFFLISNVHCPSNYFILLIELSAWAVEGEREKKNNNNLSWCTLGNARVYHRHPHYHVCVIVLCACAMVVGCRLLWALCSVSRLVLVPVCVCVCVHECVCSFSLWNCQKDKDCLQ